MEELKEFLQQEIANAREYFTSDEHFEEVFEQAGYDEENMRIYDAGYIKGCEAVLREIQDKYEDSI
tara:strand:- start:186 stop:383 length:198 start_codon:yes stop_codon:yes gene_type:complete